MYVPFAQFVTEKFVKKLRGEGKDKTEAALERLDWLTKDEGLSVVAQTLGEVNKIKRLWFRRLLFRCRDRRVSCR